MTALRLDPQWLPSDLDEPGEAATFAEIIVAVDGDPVAQLENPDTGAVYEGTQIPTLPLAIGLARRWWRLLHEPEKHSDRRVEARHRLDVLTPGYVFPPLALWSAGEGIVARLLTPDLRFQRQRFILPERDEPWYLPRTPVESALSVFIEATIARLDKEDSRELDDTWQKLKTSLVDPEERAWCIAAGRLGFDPYDAETPDLDDLAGTLSPALFADLSEAATVDELPAARSWIEARTTRLAQAAEIEVGDLGVFPSGEPDDYPAHVGYAAADHLRAVMGLDPNPRQVVKELLGSATAAEREAPHPVQGVGHRANGVLRAAVAAPDDEDARFRLLRATFVGWQASPGDDIFVGRVKTRRHQAAGAFAAEILAPRRLLEHRTQSRRPSEGDVER